MKHWAKLWAIIGSLFFAPFVGWGCGYSTNPEIIRSAIFRNDLSMVLPFRNFSYCYGLIYGDASGILLSNDDRVKNCTEWANALNIPNYSSDVNVVLYDASADLIISCVRDHSLVQHFAGNHFVEVISKPQNKAFLDYLCFAKEEEFLQENRDNPWNELLGSSESIPSIRTTNVDPQSRIEHTSNPFLRERYAFQLLRRSYYSDDFSTVIQLYDTYFKTSTSVVELWARLYYANALKGTDRMLMLADIFEQSCDKKVYCYLAFSDVDDFTQYIHAAKSDQQKASIIAMRCFHNSGRSMTDLQQIAELNNLQKSLPALIVRELNKLEEWTIGSWQDYNETGELTAADSVSRKNMKNDSVHCVQLENLCASLAQKSNATLRNFYLLAAAHAACLRGDAVTAQADLLLIDKDIDFQLEMQLNAERIFLMTQQKHVPAEDELEKTAEWMLKAASLRFIAPSVNRQLYSMSLLLSQMYEKHNNIAYAGLFYNLAIKFSSSNTAFSCYESRSFYSEFYDQYQSYYQPLAYFDAHATIHDIDRVLDIEQNITNSALNRLFFYFSFDRLAPQMYYNDYESFHPSSFRQSLLDLRGTIAFRSHQFKLAYESFAQLPDNYWQTVYEFNNHLVSNPFVLMVVDSALHRDTYHFSKTALLKQILDLQNRIAKNPKDADALLNMANLFYNCTRWGKSWMMYSYSKSDGDMHSLSWDLPWINNGMGIAMQQPDWVSDWHECRTATAYYQKVLAAKATANQRTLALVMLHVCEMNRRTALNDESLTSAIPYLKEVYERFANTTMFKHLRCSGLDDYYSQYLN